MADNIAKEGAIPDVAGCFFATREVGGYLGRKVDWREEEHPLGVCRSRMLDELRSRGLLNMNV